MSVPSSQMFATFWVLDFQADKTSQLRKCDGHFVDKMIYQ